MTEEKKRLTKTLTILLLVTLAALLCMAACDSLGSFVVGEWFPVDPPPDSGFGQCWGITFGAYGFGVVCR